MKRAGRVSSQVEVAIGRGRAIELAAAVPAADMALIGDGHREGTKTWRVLQDGVRLPGLAVPLG